MPEKVPPNEITKAIRGVNYPARKDKILQQARQNNAPPNVMDTLQRLPDREFDSSRQVEQAFGEMW